MTGARFFTKLIVVPVLLLLAWVGSATEDTLAQNIPGGYSATALTEDVKRVAEFAVQEQCKRQKATLKLRSIFKAEKQIVAGVNYRLDIMVK